MLIIFEARRHRIDQTRHSGFPNIAVIQNLNLASQELPFAEGLSSGDAAALVAKPYSQNT